MKGRKYEFLIVGSGAGGATLARELSKNGKEVLVVEKGRYEEKIGTFRDALRYFDANRLTKTPAKSKEGVILWRALMAGGSTVVSAGNATRCLEEELGDFGIALDEEFAEAEREMGVCPIAEELLSEGSERIMWASKELGYKMEPMPKFIDPVKCQKCGQCLLGCVKGAKWTALDYLEEARQHGADILYSTTIEQVLLENGRVKGVRGVGPHGEIEIPADVVILAAGGLGTPVILQQSGIRDAGHGLFVDLFVNTYGVTEGLNQIHEPSMTLVDHEFHQSKGFILSPHVNHHRMVRFMEIGARGPALPTRRLMGIMTKIVDEPVGRVYPDGTVSKPVTKRDWTRLQGGSSIAKEILVKAGADGKSIVVSKPQGAHPGGTAAMGKVVDKHLQTKVDSLFVCDASVFPTPPGAPPILTIVALAKRLAKTLAF
ncbi:MAG: GMC family oxidoreductase [Anaerolineae bacterium]|jgi:choline dehydrogenase-like flavoprotein|nr:GMC family oxidoreductase [Anaerolineae bacterium]